MEQEERRAVAIEAASRIMAARIARDEHLQSEGGDALDAVVIADKFETYIRHGAR